MLTPEQAALVVPLLQKLTASGYTMQELQPMQKLQPMQEGASITDMFHKKKKKKKKSLHQR